MTDNNIAEKKINNLSFEAALKKLEETLLSMEDGSKDLDQVIENYEYGVNLKKHLEKKLTEAKLKISKISEN
jgi:exodeoxyribonuclease VII small subunit